MIAIDLFGLVIFATVLYLGVVKIMEMRRKYLNAVETKDKSED